VKRLRAILRHIRTATYELQLWITGRWRRDDMCTHSLLGLTGEGELVPLEAIRKWTNAQCREAEQWAGAVHLQASDNDDVSVPPCPAHVKEHDTPANRLRIQREEEAFWQRMARRTQEAQR